MIDPPASAPRIVLDTNVCLDLFVFRDPACRDLETAIRAGRLACITRSDCREEWHRVLRYPALGLDDEARVAHELAFDACVMIIDMPPDPSALPRCKDPDDQKFLELARDARAVAVLTRDAAVLALANRVRRAGLFDIVEPRRLARADAPAWWQSVAATLEAA